jgi:hypothetical protein
VPGKKIDGHKWTMAKNFVRHGLPRFHSYEAITEGPQHINLFISVYATGAFHPEHRQKIIGKVKN